MKTTIKRLAAYLLALLLVLQIMPGYAAEESGSFSQGYIKFRERLQITAEDGVTVPSVMKVGTELQLKATDGYEKISWATSDSNVATVDKNGLVTAVGAGRVRITVNAEDKYSDSINLQVIGESKPEKSDSGETGPITIVINGGKTKVTYDGQVHENPFKAFDEDGNDITSQVRLTEEGKKHQAAMTDCGSKQDEYVASDFEYDGNATFEINNGWLQIKPVKISIKIDDKTKEEGAADPEFTATVTSGLIEGDIVDLSKIKYTTELGTDGITRIKASNVEQNVIIGNYRVEAIQDGVLTITPSPKYNGTYILGIRQYSALLTSEVKSNKRLATVKYEEASEAGMIREPSKLSYWTFEMQPSGKYYISSNGLYLNISNKEQALSMTSTPQELIVEDAGSGRIAVKNDNQYRLNLKSNSISEGVQGSQWNKGSGPANNEIFTRYRGVSDEPDPRTVEQDLYNMLSVNGDKNYYRLRKTSIVAAKYASSMEHGTLLKQGEYEMEQYDFTNVKIVIDEEEYKYSPVELTGEYESYFTVDFENIKKEDRFNNDADWYKNENGWLDGSKEQLGNLPNETVGFHANYKATLHRGTKKARSVTISSDWPEGKIAYPGAVITLTATLQGFSENVILQWQYSTDLKEWIDQPGANALTYTYILDETTAYYYWRVSADEAN